MGTVLRQTGYPGTGNTGNGLRPVSGAEGLLRGRAAHIKMQSNDFFGKILLRP